MKYKATQKDRYGNMKSLEITMDNQLQVPPMTSAVPEYDHPGEPRGTDTVPAWLTPGEFVVNKKSAQRMGYGKLRGMNKYASGGKVQRFAGGGGVTSGSGAFDSMVGVFGNLRTEFIINEKAKGRFNVNFKSLDEKRALLHGHCHQKAFNLMTAVESVLSMVPKLEVSVAKGSCCGMAGAFGYKAKNYGVSMAMAEADLFPAVRSAAMETIIVADGISCRHQIADGVARESLHVARVLDLALDEERVSS